MWNRNFYNIINAFTSTSDQFNASLLNKSINLYPPPPPKSTDLKLLICSVYCTAYLIW